MRHLNLNEEKNMMKRFVLLTAVAAIVFVFIPAARAQDHAEVGAFVDYFRLHDTATNYVGIGGRAAFNVAAPLQIEAEMSYDFGRAYAETFGNASGVVGTQNSHIKVLHGLFGPKLQTPGPVRVFVTAKGGFVNFRFDTNTNSFAGFTSSVQNLRDHNVSAVFYPGGGVEAFLGPVGLRAEAGDEIIFTNVTRHNWKVTFGPQIRF
jgi:hypothetical protein